jgi:hypothetical protein
MNLSAVVERYTKLYLKFEHLGKFDTKIDILVDNSGTEMDSFGQTTINQIISFKGTFKFCLEIIFIIVEVSWVNCTRRSQPFFSPAVLGK